MEYLYELEIEAVFKNHMLGFADILCFKSLLKQKQLAFVQLFENTLII